MFEYGGGGSSLWLVDRGADLTVVEHHPEWAAELRAKLPSQVEVLEVSKSTTGTADSPVEDGYFDDYAASISRYPNDGFDLVIVDGRVRVSCVEHSVNKVKPGGMLLLDDSTRPRYQLAHEMLSNWVKTSLIGLKIGYSTPTTTTVWQRVNASN